jgi:hypothetical protein
MARRNTPPRARSSFNPLRRAPKKSGIRCGLSASRPFQSTSARARRRNKLNGYEVLPDTEFQSTSARARRRNMSVTSRMRMRSFNPRRRAHAEEMCCSIQRIRGTRVSIHFGARTPKKYLAYVAATRAKSFNPLRRAHAEEIFPGVPVALNTEFQSTSARARRRNVGKMQCRSIFCCFNPLRRAHAEEIRSVASHIWYHSMFQSTSARARRRNIPANERRRFAERLPATTW